MLVDAHIQHTYTFGFGVVILNTAYKIHKSKHVDAVDGWQCWCGGSCCCYFISIAPNYVESWYKTMFNDDFVKYSKQKIKTYTRTHTQARTKT